MEQPVEYVIKPKEPANDMPPWLRRFFLCVIKRCAGIIIAWIDDEVKEKPNQNNKPVAR